MNGSSFLVGEKVRYWSKRHSRWVDAHVQRVNCDPSGRLVSYDLTNKPQAALFKVRAASTPATAPPPPPPLDGESPRGEPPAGPPDRGAAERAGPTPQVGQARQRSQSLRVGEQVEYWSASAVRWVPAKVLKVNAELGLCDLDVKAEAPVGKVRKAKTTPECSVTQPIQDSAGPSAGPTSRKHAPPPPLSCGFKVNDKVQYWSDTKTKWLEASVQAIREKDGGVVYDLDLKKGAPADRVRPSLVTQITYQVNEEVEYWSTSAGRWLSAKVLRLHPQIGQCDLDVKPNAPLGRMRRVAGVIAVSAAQVSEPQTEEPQISPTSSAGSGQQDGTGGQDGTTPEKAQNDPLQLNQLLHESKASAERQAAVKKAPPPPCVGAWCNGAKTLRISESGERLLVDMGPQTPTLVLVEIEPAEQQAWPRQWSAVRKSSSGRSQDAKRALYILELESAESDKLLVKQPVGEGQVEFVRVCSEQVAKPNPQSGSDGQSDPSPPCRERSRSPRRQ